MSDNRASDRRGVVARGFTVFAIALMFIGLASFAFGAWRLIDGLATSSWPTTTAVVSSAEVVRTSTEPGKATQHEYRVTVEYTVDGQTHALTFRTNLRTVEPRVGSTQSIRYNPSDPADARRGTGGADVVAGPILGVLGIAVAIGGIYLFRRSRRGPMSLPAFRATRTISRSIDLGKSE